MGYFSYVCGNGVTTDSTLFSVTMLAKSPLKDRFNEHRRTIDNPNTKPKPTTAAEHFLSSTHHTANDMQLIAIEKVFSDRDSIRKASEASFY